MSPVSYVDPQRSMAVVVGVTDIRSEILKHRGRLKDSMLVDEPGGPGFLLLLEQASSCTKYRD